MMPKTDLNFTNLKAAHAGLLYSTEDHDPFVEFLAQSKDDFGTETCNFDTSVFFAYDPSLDEAVLGEKPSSCDDNSSGQGHLDGKEATLTIDPENTSDDDEPSAETDNDPAPMSALGRNLRERARPRYLIPEWMDEVSENCMTEGDESANADEYAPAPLPNLLKRNREGNDEDEGFSMMGLWSSSTMQQARKKERISKIACPPEEWTAKEIHRWTCKSCGFVQRNKRKCDLSRHERKHVRIDSEAFVCCGIRESSADSSIRAAPAEKRAERIYVRGAWRVGGCQRTFTRLDALKRHLRSQPGFGCMTDYYEFHPRNRLA